MSNVNQNASKPATIEQVVALCAEAGASSARALDYYRQRLSAEDVRAALGVDCSPLVAEAKRMAAVYGAR